MSRIALRKYGGNQFFVDGNFDNVRVVKMLDSQERWGTEKVRSSPPPLDRTGGGHWQLSGPSLKAKTFRRNPYPRSKRQPAVK